MFWLLDIDECEDRDDLCEQGCVNYPGGYTCGCLSSYHIVGEGPQVRCLGKQNYQLFRSCRRDRLTPIFLEYFHTRNASVFLDKPLFLSQCCCWKYLLSQLRFWMNNIDMEDNTEPA